MGNILDDKTISKVQMLVEDRTADTATDCYDNRPRGEDGKIAAIVLHHTGGRNSLSWLSGGHSVSTHKLFAKDGTIFKIVPERKRAWHAGQSEYAGRTDWNDFSLGYEIENMGDGRDPYPPLQYEAVAMSCCYDCALYRIPDFWIRCHREIALPRGRKQDPDLTFDLNHLWNIMRRIREDWPFPIPRWYC